MRFLSDNVSVGARKNFSREEMLEKATPAFWKYAFSEAAGVNKSELYTEFRDKEDLL
jgi:TetR/AcrR family transcriptional regulator, copper-responsive repressor